MRPTEAVEIYWKNLNKFKKTTACLLEASLALIQRKTSGVLQSRHEVGSVRLFEEPSVVWTHFLSLMKRCRCKGKQSALSELLLTPTSTPHSSPLPPLAPPPLPTSSYSSTSSPLPLPPLTCCSVALIQDELSGHVGISPNRGSGLNRRVGEDASEQLSQRRHTEASVRHRKSFKSVQPWGSEEAFLRFPCQ